MHETHRYISVFRNTSQVWWKSDFIFWDTKRALWLRTVNNSSFEIDYLLGRKSSHDFSAGVSSCCPVSKVKFSFSQGNSPEINPPHTLQFLADRSCQYVYKSLAFLCSLFLQLLVFAAFDSFRLFSISFHVDSSYAANDQNSWTTCSIFGGPFCSKSAYERKVLL